MFEHPCVFSFLPGFREGRVRENGFVLWRGPEPDMLYINN